MMPAERGEPALRVGIVGCGLVGRKRAAALGSDELVASFDVDLRAASSLTADFGGTTSGSLDSFSRRGPTSSSSP